MYINKLKDVEHNLNQSLRLNNNSNNFDKVLKNINNSDANECEFDLNSLEIFIGKSELKTKNISKCLIDK